MKTYILAITFIPRVGLFLKNVYSKYLGGFSIFLKSAHINNKNLISHTEVLLEDNLIIGSFNKQRIDYLFLDYL
jgi:hypothetical protein